MRKTILFLAMVVALANQSLFAQVPSYVPTNGLVGYWPFNGNANDESGNGNNATVIDCVSINDRNGNPNSAYQFGGSRNVSVPMTLQIYDLAQRTFACWFKANGAQNGGRLYETTFKNGGIGLYNGNVFDTWYGYSQHCCNIVGMNGGELNQWHHLVSTADDSNGLTKVYLDGVLIASSDGYPAGGGCIINSNWQGEFIRFGLGASGESFNGDIDDIAMYNRALNQQEITNLYTSVSSSECLTMTINTGVLSTNPVTYTSSVSIYPNPANDQITIDCGNLANVSGWSIKITNMQGQEVFSQPMNTQQYVVPLNTWSGQGMYFVKIINAQNEVVNIKKIILQ